jgi:hypothetical protein
VDVNDKPKGNYDGIEEAHVMVCVITPDYFDTPEVCGELKYAIALKKPIVILRHKDAEIPEDIRSKFTPVHEHVWETHEDMARILAMIAVTQGPDAEYDGTWGTEDGYSEILNGLKKHARKH